MEKNEKQKTINFFKNKLKEYGDSPQASDWGKAESQEKRYEIFTKYYDLNQKKILDIGCGLGNFYIYLKKQKIKCDFTGYDIVSDVIEKAKKKSPDAKFEVKDILNDKIEEKFDYIFLSGTFNYKIKNHEIWVKKMIKKMYELSKIGIGFNVLSIHADFMDKNYYYADPVKITKYCLTLTRNLCLKHDYFPHDLTIFMNKENWKKND